MLKKMMLLAGMALAAIAFAVPASASAAEEWTDNGAKIGIGASASDTLSGFISFGNPEAGQNKFGCTSHAGFTVNRGTTGTLTSFTPTTGTCAGEGVFAGCVLTADSTTLPLVGGVSQAKIHIVGTNEVTLTTPAGSPIILHNEYAAPCPIEKSTLEVTTLVLKSAPSLNSNLTDVTVSGGAVSFATPRGGVVGPATPVAVFGTMGTATHTITIS